MWLPQEPSGEAPLQILRMVEASSQVPVRELPQQGSCSPGKPLDDCRLHLSDPKPGPSSGAAPNSWPKETEHNKLLVF